MPQTPEPRDDAAYEEVLDRVTIGGARPLEGRVALVDHDPAWPHLFAQEAARVRSALGERVHLLEHVGSTSVPGLAAKPVIDLVLEVLDSADEPAYAPDLEAAGYVLRIREPEFFEHRLFKGPGADINLHVFSQGCEETRRMMVFRDRLRACPEERDLYLRVKRELAGRDWKYTQQYADAKTSVILEILARAEGEAPGEGPFKTG
jgi:GrpB-like predicted nucleotidyltransferase (UPF0157 family)